MRYFKNNDNMLWVNKTLPNVSVKTYFGNTYLNKLFRDKWMVIYTNPYDLIPSSAKEKTDLIESLDNLKAINCQLVGFSSRSFNEHLECTNWINSYLSDENVFPVFYQEEDVLESFFQDENKDINKQIENPIYLVDRSGVARIIVRGESENGRNIKAILSKLGEVILNEQLLQQKTFES